MISDLLIISILVSGSINDHRLKISLSLSPRNLFRSSQKGSMNSIDEAKRKITGAFDVFSLEQKSVQGHEIRQPELNEISDTSSTAALIVRSFDIPVMQVHERTQPPKTRDKRKREKKISDWASLFLFDENSAEEFFFCRWKNDKFFAQENPRRRLPESNFDSPKFCGVDLNTQDCMIRWISLSPLPVSNCVSQNFGGNQTAVTGTRENWSVTSCVCTPSNHVREWISKEREKIKSAEFMKEDQNFNVPIALEPPHQALSFINP